MRIAAALILVACSGGAKDDDGGTNTVPAENQADLLLSDLTRLEVEVASGDALIGGFDTPDLEVWIREGEAGDTWDHGVEEGVASLWAVCPTGERGCGTGFDLVVPNELPVIVSSFDGPVVVDGHEGTLQVLTNAGPVTVRERPTSSVTITTRSGPVDVTFREDPQMLDVITVSGDIDVALPGQDYELVLASTNGNVTEEGVRHVPGAPRIRVSSQEGDITVHGTGS